MTKECIDLRTTSILRFPLRPKGAPLFAAGDLKDKFIYYRDQLDDKPPHASISHKRLDAQRDYGPSTPLSTPGGSKVTHGEVTREEILALASTSSGLGDLLGDKPLPVAARQELAQGYAAAVTYLDHEVRQLLANAD